MVWLWLLGCPRPPTEAPEDIVSLARLDCTRGPVSEAAFDIFDGPDVVPTVPPYLHGAGVLAEDLTGNGLLEVVAIRDGDIEVFGLADGEWSLLDGIPDVDLALAFGAVAADWDDDGDADLFVTRWGAPNLALENDGTGRFTEVTSALDVAGPAGHHSASPSFADIDGDGDLDLFVAGHGFVDEADPDPTRFEPADDSLLFFREGEAFVPAGDWLPQDTHDRYTFQGAFVDFDRDGDLDLLMVNDFGRRYRSGQLLWNEGQAFVPDGNEVGLDLAVAGMGLGIADLNADDVPDVFVPYWGGYAMMVSTAGLWADFSVPAGLSPALNQNQTVGWGTMFGDLDNDGDEDAVVMHGFIETAISPNTEGQPDGIFLADGPHWSNTTLDWIDRDESDSRGVVVADFDRDGRLDYARPDLSGPTRIHMGRCGSGSALEIELVQDGPNRNAVGAEVVVRTDKDHWRAVIAGGEGYGGSRPHRLHVGLGAVAVADIEVRWPDGTRTHHTHEAGHLVQIRKLASPVQ